MIAQKCIVDKKEDFLVEKDFVMSREAERRERTIQGGAPRLDAPPPRALFNC